MEKRLETDLEMKNAYQATIEKDTQSNFVRKLDQEEINKTENDTQWYLPHHPVKHPHKPGKVRRVCNAASKFKGVSLNDKLLSGPEYCGIQMITMEFSSTTGMCLEQRVPQRVPIMISR